MRRTNSVALILGLVLLHVGGVARCEDGLTITTKPLAEWTQYLSYAQSLGATGGVDPYVWWVDDGELPPGLSLTASGVLAGTPLDAGTFSFTVMVGDVDNTTATLEHTMKINESVTVTSNDPEPWTVERGVTFYLHAEGGTGSLAWSKISGSLPAGIELSSEGVLSGAPEEAGTYSIVVQAEDSLHATGERPIVWVINSTPQIGKLTRTSWTVQRFLSATIGVEGGTAPYSWTFEGDGGGEPGDDASGLPAGVVFKSLGEMVELAGTPTESGTFLFVARVEDACGVEVSGEFEIAINRWPIFGTETLPMAVQGVGYDFQFDVDYGTSPTTFRILDGDLPEGLSLESNGSISGAPEETGNFGITVVAEDAAGATVAESTSSEVKPGCTSDPVTFPDWTAGRPFKPMILTASGGDGDIRWTSKPSVPTGMYLSNGGLLTGKPRDAGVYEFEIVARCDGGSRAVLEVVWNVNPKPEIITTEVPEWAADRPYSAEVETEGGTQPVRLTVSGGQLPPGLTIEAEGMATAVSGTPTEPGTYAFAITLRDARGAEVNRAYQLVINETPEITEVEIDWTVGKSISRSFTGKEYIAPQQWRLSAGEIPAGMYLRLDGMDAQVHGTPGETGEHVFAIDFEDEMGALESVRFTLTIHAAMNADEPELLMASGRETNTFLPLTGGTPPHSWAVVSGRLPPGLTIDPDTGELSGTPYEPGSYELAAFVTDGCQTTIAVPVTIHVAERIFSDLRKETELAGSDTFHHYWFDALEGTKIRLKSKLTGSTVLPAISLLGPDGAAIDMGSAASTGKKAFSIKNFVIPETGRYYIRVDNRDARASGTFKTSLKLKPAKRFSFDGDLSGPGDTDIVAIPLPAGTLSLKVGADGRIDPGSMLLEAPDGDLVSLAALGSLRSGEKRFVVKRLSIPASGVYRLHVNTGSAGSYRATIRVRPNQPHTCRLPE